MNGMLTISHCPVLEKIRNQTTDSVVRRCLFAAIFSTILC
ncbi:unnamed protein product [Acanthoscelides obtectus]|uniref:Uncharacterized protein n=1 Tax=Acanthoscelides obtectus TaxID=200917 RepID=A0A9P0M0Z3_ACAOB|nr:unnamed protein product [Acanthoscelides obtectus]CAH2006533.1 unnamed protein product [Acanthoscelides obtectus]CAK1676960.1 hypothetical protein AOBTE_LOCUS31028 [Acanthoscelides obtectus]CAK1676962.1 hypothetical protein AOBTE_LOCUS31030 [Acanthoscelides obtectus]